MDFALTDEQKLIVDAARQFTENELMPYKKLDPYKDNQTGGGSTPDPTTAHMWRAHDLPPAVKITNMILLRALKELKRSFGDTHSLHLPDRPMNREGERDAR